MVRRESGAACTSCITLLAVRTLGPAHQPPHRLALSIHTAPPSPCPTLRAATHVPLAHHLHSLRRGGQPHQQVLLQVLAVVRGLEKLVLQQLRQGGRGGVDVEICGRVRRLVRSDRTRGACRPAIAAARPTGASQAAAWALEMQRDAPAQRWAAWLGP